MTNGGDAAEQIVRLSLEGFEVAAKLTGSAAKNIAVLLTSVLKQEVSQSNKTRGKARLTNMIKSGKELKVFSLSQRDLQKFTEQAKNTVFSTVSFGTRTPKAEMYPLILLPVRRTLPKSSALLTALSLAR